jgi:hypothetical protein
MSTENAAPQNAPKPGSTGRSATEIDDDVGRSSLDVIEVKSLQIDESFSTECDPYNSTGQFLAQKIKERTTE